MSRRLPWLLLPLAAFLADWASKAWVLAHLTPGHPVPVIRGCFNLTLGFNPGAIFGSFAQAPALVRTLLFSVVGVLALGYFGYELLKEGTPMLQRVAMGLILGGALGNNVDRLQHGAVVDFLDFYHRQWQYWTFNVADSCITCGAILLGYAILRSALAARAADASGQA